VNVGWKAVRFIQGADTDESDSIVCTSVVAPNRNATPGAAGDLLTLATVRWCVDDFSLSLEQLYTVGFDERVQGKRGSGFALAPAAVTAVNE
jgi:hypothetical protein